MVDSTLPYITSGVGLPIMLQPYDFDGARMGVFFLDCREDALNALLDRYINGASLGRLAYRCLASQGKAVAFMIMAGMTVNVRNTDGRECGREPYSELSFWIPCWDGRSGKAGLFLPFLFPDSFSAIATGREMFGFRKTPASFTFPNGRWNPVDPRFTASVRGFAAFGPDQVAQTLELLSVGKADAEAGGEAGAAHSLLGAAAALVERGAREAVDSVERAAGEATGETAAVLERALADAVDALTGGRGLSAGLVADALSSGAFLESLVRRLGTADAAEELAGELTGDIGARLLPLLNSVLRACPSIFLKQFPSVEDARRAEVRSITAAPFQVRALRGGFPWVSLFPPKLKSFALTFSNLASHPVAEELGLTGRAGDGNTTVVDAKGLWLDVDFSLETGETVADITPKKKKIAVLGGGIGSLAAVYGITQTPGWQDKYEITLYQVGWRIGGKGASGRNRAIADRIEEHGLHIWFGYYENSFRVMRECYEALARPANAPLATWDMAFKPHNTIVVEEYVADRPHLGGPWSHWYVPFGETPGLPGDGTPQDDHPAVLLTQTGKLLGHLSALLNHPVLDDATRDALADKHLAGLAPAAAVEAAKPADRLTALAGLLPKTAEHARAFAAELADAGKAAEWGGIFDKILQFIKDLAAALAVKLEEMAASIAGRLEPALQALLEPFAQSVDSVFRLLTMAELGFVIVKGVLKDGVLWHGYSAINQHDFTKWLLLNGASEATANSVLVRAFYDLYLAFPDGKATVNKDGVAIGGNVSAGELLHSYVLVVLCYKGSIMWKMQAGMGDTVMTPLYQVLKQRGVRFEFFHKVANLGLNPATEATRLIDTIAIDVQATLKPDVKEYNPLYDVKGLPCWPSTPLYEQLEQGAELRAQNIDLESSWSPWQPVARKTLTRGEDFDEVILGISVAALPYITPELVAANPAWAAMLANAATTQTQAMQLWNSTVLEETGWPLPSPILDAYADPFNTWASMDQTLDKESWPQSALPFAIQYLCNNMDQVDPIPPFTDHTYPERELERVKGMARDWLDANAAHLWPNMAQAAPGGESGYDWSKLVDLENRTGEARLDGQYFRANVEPTERYVCNKAGTNQYRLKTDGSGFKNLFLTGDWIDNGSLNLGCVESTVIAGLQAARALTGYPLPIARVDVVSANTEPAPAEAEAAAEVPEPAV